MGRGHVKVYQPFVADRVNTKDSYKKKTKLLTVNVFAKCEVFATLLVTMRQSVCHEFSFFHCYAMCAVFGHD